MKIGLISPIPHLNSYGFGDFHLVLSHLLEFPEYRDHYRKQAMAGAYIVLDNSAHELGAGQAPEVLLCQAFEVHASELVLPDALFESERTIDLTREALRYYSYRKEEVEHLRFMLVPQSSTIWDWGICLQSLIDAHTEFFPEKPFTIGISKDYEKWIGGLPNLVSRYLMSLRNEYDFETHLLGWGRQLHVLSALSSRFPWIRSTDSAKPFVYAAAEMRLDLSRYSPEYPTRPEDYFHLTLSSRLLEIANHNIDIFRIRAGGYIA